MSRSQFYLAAELLLLFVVFPGVLAVAIDPKWLFILMWLFSAACGLWLWRDRTFDNHRFFRVRGIGKAMRPILLRFAVLGGLMTIGTYWLAPDRWLGFVRHAPQWWAIVMVLYPFLSVYPQGLIWRGFVLHRYRALLGAEAGSASAGPAIWPATLLSAIVFAWVHITLHNWIAPTFTLLGGIMFARTYLKTRSLTIASIEHALYGDLIFTIGLGRFFYAG